ncbi:ANTAR domain-containing protein [Streptomyces sp. NPDC087437]|uniref:ANTAR domain-containing protein n=1 Tax=Streptomyces sp. NPDC087437 TaxID=3365789 RepID=UPI003807C410
MTPDLAAETRRPAYTPYALSGGARRSRSGPVGVRCVRALPLVVTGEAGAAIDFYGLEPGAFRAGRHRARAFAARAADAVDLAPRLERDRAAVSDVRTALVSHSAIDQAIGVLTARERGDAGKALDRPRHTSQHRNTKLRDLATDLVSRVTDPARPPVRRPVGQAAGPVDYAAGSTVPWTAWMSSSTLRVVPMAAIPAWRTWL